MKIILSLLGVYAVLGFIVLPLILKPQIEKNLNELLIPNASLESVSFNPFTFSVGVQNLVLKDKTNQLIKFKEFSADLALLKSIHQGYVNLKEVKLDELVIHAVQQKDGSINLQSLLKPQEEKTEKSSAKEESSPFNFKISKTILNKAHINLSVLTGDNPITINSNPLNYTFYDLGIYPNALASHSLTARINKNTQLDINGGFSLTPFKMYGNVKINNLNTNDYLPYASDMLNFDASDAQINLKLGFQLDLSKQLSLKINHTDFELNNLNLSQNKKDFVGLKSFQIKNFNLLYPKQDINIEGINLNDFFAHALINNNGTLNFSNLIKSKKATEQVTVAPNTSPTKETQKTWKIAIKEIHLNRSNLTFNDSKNKTQVSSKKIDVRVDKINFQTNETEPSTLNVHALSIKQPYSRVNNDTMNLVAKNLNLKVDNIFNQGNYLKVKQASLNNPKLAISIKKTKKTAQKEPSKAKKEPKKKTEKAPTNENKDGFNLELGPFTISKANILFEDQNLPIPFKANISKLNGNFSELITKSSKPTKLNLEGKVNKYGYTKITGFVDHKNIKNLTDVQLLFKNIAINKFTPYSGKFVGRELAGGKLNLNLKYNITKSNIDAKNSIIIDNIKLGKQIQSPDAMSLPLDFAIALMEDSDGVIDLNVPISGNVDDPQFSIAPIVWKAFTNLIIKAIASPFSFLASLFDFDEEEIKSVEFAFGNSILIASEKETLDKIAQIFAKRPNLALKIQPTFNSVLDTKALQNKKFELFIDNESKKIKKGEDKYLIALETNYQKDKESKSLKEVKKQFINKEAKSKKDAFDKDAYVAFIKEVLVSKQIVLPQELETLANTRAKAIVDYLKTAHKADANRVVIHEKTKDDTKSKEWAVFDLEVGIKSK